MARAWWPLGLYASKGEAMRAVEGERGVGFAVDLRVGLAWRFKESSWIEMPRAGPSYRGGWQAGDGDGAGGLVFVWGWVESPASAGGDFALGCWPSFTRAAAALQGDLGGVKLIGWECETLECRQRGRGLPIWTQRHPPRRQPAAEGQGDLLVEHLKMGTKNNPGAFDCHAAAEPDEPLFVLLGRDVHAARLVEMWALMRARAGEDEAKVAEALACAAAMDRWAVKLGKLPGANPPYTAEIENTFMALTRGMECHPDGFEQSCDCDECRSCF